MMDVDEFQTLFDDGSNPFDNNIDYKTNLETVMNENGEDLAKIGHHMWMTPINYVAELIEIVDKLNPKFHKESMLNISMLSTKSPAFNTGQVDDSIKEFSEHIKQDVAKFVTSTPRLKTEKQVLMGANNAVFNVQTQLGINYLYYYMFLLRYYLAPKIIKAAQQSQPQVVPEKSHPIWKIPAVVEGGKIGDLVDTRYTKSIISSNDVSGVLVKLKTVYMRAAYLQLIQTLSQLAEKKSYQSITFRQDELRAVLDQIKKLSADTYRQLKLEDDVVNKICFNIIKLVDPNADLKETMEALSMDIGKYPANAFNLVKHEFD